MYIFNSSAGFCFHFWGTASNFMGVSLRRHVPTRTKVLKTNGKISAVATATAAVVETTPTEEAKEYACPLEFSY